MKRLIFFSLLFSQFARAQSFEERITSIQNYSQNIVPVQEKAIEEAQQKISIFQNSDFLKKDEEEKKIYLEKVSLIKNETEQLSNSYSVFSAQEKLKYYNKLLNDKKIYEEAKSFVDKANKSTSYSNGLKKYMEALSNGQYTKADIQKALLNLNDRLIAEDYEKNLFTTKRESNTYTHNLKELKTTADQINYELSFPENAIKKMTFLGEELKLINSTFSNFQNKFEHQTQFDFTYKSNWDVGLFSCAPKDSPKYLRLKNYPDLIILDNGGSTKSVLKLDPENPKQLNIVYKCKKMGMFGACLDNKEKSLCQLDTECKESLDQAMKSYDRKTFYPEVKTNMVETFLEDLKQTLKDPMNLTLLSEYERTNRLGFYRKDELLAMIDKIKTSVQGFSSSSPEDLMIKVKNELSVLEKNESSRLAKLAGFNANQPKGQDSLNLLKYMTATIQSKLEEILNDDQIEKYSYQQCLNGIFPITSFCESYKNFKSKVSRFKETEEVINAVPEECPKMVFRFEKTEKTSVDLSTCKVIDPRLNSNLENFILNFDSIQKKINE
jgi:hypothetical protein